MRYRSALFLCPLALLLVGAGCGSEGGGQSTTRRDDDTVDDGKRDSSRQRDIDRDDPTPGECACDPNEVCEPESGECLPLDELPEGELYGEVELLRQVFEESRNDRIGTAHAQFFVYEQPPALSLQEFYTDENELCLLYDSDDHPLWPQGRQLDAGELTIEVDDGEGPIVLETWNASSGDAHYFVKKDNPPDVGSVSGHFAEEYIPHDATFTVEAAGGADIGAFSFDAGRTPQEFEIDPRGELTDDGELVVRWDPPQPAATMEIILTAGMMESYLVCTVRDDGEAKVWGFGTSVQLRRTTARLATVEADGEELKLLVQARHARLRNLCISDNCDDDPQGGSRGH